MVLFGTVRKAITLEAVLVSSRTVMWSQILSEFQTIWRGGIHHILSKILSLGVNFWQFSSLFEQFSKNLSQVKCQVFLGMLTNDVKIDVSIEGNGTSLRDLSCIFLMTFALINLVITFCQLKISSQMGINYASFFCLIKLSSSSSSIYHEPQGKIFVQFIVFSFWASSKLVHLERFYYLKYEVGIFPITPPKKKKKRKGCIVIKKPWYTS